MQPQAQHTPCLPQDSWERARSKAPSPDKQGRSAQHQDEVSGGNKDEVANTQMHTLRLWMPAGESLAKTDPDLDSPWSGWRVGLCERPGACLEQKA